MLPHAQACPGAHAPSLNSVLNKITPEKFDRLMEQLLVRAEVRGGDFAFSHAPLGTWHPHGVCAQGNYFAYLRQGVTESCVLLLKPSHPL